MVITVSDTWTWIQCLMFIVIVIETMSRWISYWYLFSRDGWD